MGLFPLVFLVESLQVAHVKRSTKGRTKPQQRNMDHQQWESCYYFFKSFRIFFTCPCLEVKMWPVALPAPARARRELKANLSRRLIDAVEHADTQSHFCMQFAHTIP
jgi:hypothetical protein